MMLHGSGSGDHPSPDTRLEQAVLERINDASLQLGESALEGQGFKQWRNRWHQDIFLIWLKQEEKSWPQIVQFFREKGFSVTKGGLKTKWRRALCEVRILYLHALILC
jgi:hypothetical protein